MNYATAVKAKAMILLADFVDQGQADGSIAARGRPENLPDGKVLSASTSSRPATNVPDLLGTSPSAAYKAIHEARRTRDALAGVDIDQVVKDANAAGEDLGLAGQKWFLTRTIYRGRPQNEGWKR